MTKEKDTIRKPRGRKIRRIDKNLKKSPKTRRKPLKIGYMRVSTEKQDHKMQYDAILACGIEPVNVFQDTISGSKITREGLRACVKFMHEGDTLYVWKIDRLSRSTRDFLNFMYKLDQKGIGFKSITENIDTTTPSGRMQMQMTIMVAEMERENIKQRVKAGIKAKREAGLIKRWGRRPKSEYDVREIKDLRDQGLTVRAIAKALNISASTVCRSLKLTKPRSKNL